MSRATRLSPRDRRILRLAAMNPLTTSQLARLLFPNRKKAAQRLRRLTANRHLKRFASPLVHPTGRPEYVYTVGRVPRTYHLLRHALLVSEVFVVLHEWLSGSPGFSGVFGWPAELRPRGDPVPDGFFVVTKEDRALLCFVEVDRGTEAATGGGYSFQSKLASYGEYFDSGRFAADLRDWGTFGSFRVAVFVPDESRMRRLIDAAAGAGADFVLFKALPSLDARTFPDHWVGPDGSAADLFGRKPDRP